MPEKLSPLSRREREIMEVVYARGGATAAEVAVHIPSPPSYSAVRAMISILETKGHLTHQRQGSRYLYLPTVPLKRAGRSAMASLVTTFFKGSSKDAVVALLDEAGRRLSAADLDELARLITEAKKQGR